MEKAPLAMAYLMSLIFTATGLVPVMQLPIWLLVIMIPPLALGTIVYMIYSQAKARQTAVETSADSSIFVPAKIGKGYSFNMANPWSRRLLAGLFLGIGLLIAFLVWSMQ